MASGFQDFCRRLLVSTRENVQSSQREIKGSVTKALATFEQIFQTVESQVAKKVPNA